MPRYHHEFCSLACETLQRHADEASADMERIDQMERAKWERSDRMRVMRAALREAIAWFEARSPGEPIVERLRRALDGGRRSG